MDQLFRKTLDALALTGTVGGVSKSSVDPNFSSHAIGARSVLLAHNISLNRAGGVASGITST